MWPNPEFPTTHLITFTEEIVKNLILLFIIDLLVSKRGLKWAKNNSAWLFLGCKYNNFVHL